MSNTLSIDEAVETVFAAEGNDTADPAVERDDAAPVDESALEGDDIPGDQPGSEEAAETPADDAGEVDDAPAETLAAEAPTHWSAEGKAVFKTLPPEAQTAILAEAEAAQRVTDKKLQETAAERKAAKAERERLTSLAAKISEAADLAESKFGSKWGKWTPDVWAELAQSDPQNHAVLKAQYDADQYAAQQAKSARAEADAVEHESWLQEQRETLATLAPELLDPEKGEERLVELGNYLVKNGVARENLPKVGALEMSIARKAMLYDAGVAKLTKPQQPAPSRPSLRPSAVEGSSSQQRTESRVKQRFEKTGSIDDAVELLLAKQG